jgi:hypothetical protein
MIGFFKEDDVSETPQQYAQRLLNNLGEQNPVEVLESTMTRLDALARVLEKKGLQNKPAPNKWTAAQILSHLAEGEIVFSYRLRKTLNDSGTAIEAYDQEQWVKNSGYLQADPHLALSLFQVLRKSNVARLKSLTPEQWAHFGIHSERGRESITQIARLTAGHDINHLRQMEIIAEL